MIAGLFTKTSLPISNRPSLLRQQHGNTTPTVLLMVLAVVALLAIGYLLVQLFSAPPTVEHSQQGPVFSSKPIATSATNTAATTAETADAGELANEATGTGPNIDDSNLAGLTDSSIPDPKAIINAKIPESESLAKEEIDRLEDERKRLVEQEKLAKEQLQLVADINQRKAAQIALLEQQIAELEKDKATAKP
ncbi:hypothetical protein PSAR109036_12420 [Psychrobacter arenosus]